MPGHIQIRVSPDEYERIWGAVGKVRGALQNKLHRIVMDGVADIENEAEAKALGDSEKKRIAVNSLENKLTLIVGNDKIHVRPDHEEWFRRLHFILKSGHEEYIETTQRKLSVVETLLKAEGYGAVGNDSEGQRTSRSAGGAKALHPKPPRHLRKK